MTPKLTRYIQNIYGSETDVQIEGNGHDDDEEILGLH